MSSGDDDRPKLSFAELDKRRRGEHTDEARPKGRWAQAQEKRATDEYKKQLWLLLSLCPVMLAIAQAELVERRRSDYGAESARV